MCGQATIGVHDACPNCGERLFAERPRRGSWLRWIIWAEVAHAVLSAIGAYAHMGLFWFPGYSALLGLAVLTFPVVVVAGFASLIRAELRPAQRWFAWLASIALWLTSWGLIIQASVSY